MTTVRKCPNGFVPLRLAYRLNSLCRAYLPGQRHSFSISKPWQITQAKPSGLVRRLVRLSGPGRLMAPAVRDGADYLDDPADARPVLFDVFRALLGPHQP